MKYSKHSFQAVSLTCASILTVLLVTGCQTGKNQSRTEPKETAAPIASAPPAPAQTAPPETPATAPAPVTPVTAPAPAKEMAVIRIKTGVSAPLTDSAGNVWMADQGFADGDTIERPDAKIEGTKDQAIYQAERYGMTRFSQPVANGTYVVKLHFAETYDGISGPGQRVFSFNVEGEEFKNFDVAAKAGGVLRAYVETVKVTVTDGKLDITFTAIEENPEINGLEIIPAS